MLGMYKDYILILGEFIYLFIYWLMFRKEGQKGRERILRRHHAQHVLIRGTLHFNLVSVWHGARSHDPEYMTCAKIRSQALNRLSHEGTPWMNIFIFVIMDGPVIESLKMECWGLYINNESWHTASKTNEVIVWWQTWHNKKKEKNNNRKLEYM